MDWIFIHPSKVVASLNVDNAAATDARVPKADFIGL